jgi:putative ABC transport system permease protein
MPALHRDGFFQTFIFRMKDPKQFDRVKKELEADPRLQIQVLQERKFYAAQSEAFTVLITVIGSFITAIMAVGAVFGAANTMYATIGARTREIAMLSVLGFGSFSIFVSFVVESVIVAVIGGLVGCVLALPMNGITSSTTNFQSFSEMAFQFHITPEILGYGHRVRGAVGTRRRLLPRIAGGTAEAHTVPPGMT